MMHIRKNDTVKVLAGKDRGKESKVLSVDPKKGKVLVHDVAVVARHTKARRQGEVAGIKKEESFIALSNIMPVCTACKLPARINVKTLEDGKKVRVCNRCKEIF